MTEGPRQNPLRAEREIDLVDAGVIGDVERPLTVVEVTEETFEAETIRKSVKHPVIVELYSPRVATSQ